MIRRTLLLFVSCLVVSSGQAQVATGTYPYGTFDNRTLDSINVGSLNIHLTMPLLNKPGRGLPFYYNLNYDSSVWTPASVSGTKTWTPAVNWGWRGDTEIATGYISYNTLVMNNPHAITPDGTQISPSCITTEYSNFQYHDGFGVSHPFGVITESIGGSNCGTSTSSGSAVTSDGSGYTLNVTNYTTATLVNSQGRTIVPPNNIAGSGNAVDSNGNQINANGSGGFTDTLGKTALTIAGGAPSNKTFSYTDASGNSQSVTMAYKTYNIRTNFQCSGIGEYSAPSVSLVDSLSFPDGSSYHFTYESTPNISGAVTGRLASVTEPTGGVISYNYPYTGSNNGVVCSDGSAAGLTRSIASTAGSAASSSTYVRTVNATAKTSHTDVTDGMNNLSRYDFVQVSFVVANSLTSTYYETSRSIFQGAASGTLLLSRQTCYNGSSSPCTTTGVTLPIAQIDTYESLNGGGPHGTTAKYNSFGLQTEQDVYDFGPATGRGGLMSVEKWAYPSSGIVNLMSSDTVTDAVGNQLSQTTYGYDETSGAGHAPLLTTSGLPQHGGAIGSQRGNLTTVTQWNNSGANLVTTSAYEDTGNPVTTTTPNGKATYAYDAATHAFATKATPPTPSSGVLLQYSATNDPATGLPLTSTDPNGQATTYKSYDALLRPTEVDFPDQSTNILSYSNPNQQGIQNPGTRTDTENHIDSYGRPDRVAVYNGQGGSDWYQQDSCFDANGKLDFQSYRYQGTGFNQAKVCSGAGDSYSYDALGRTTAIAHADGTSTGFTYQGRATQIKDENGVTRITQVDGLGRTTTVCEVSTLTTMPNSGSPVSCGTDITPSPSGFLTNYAYALSKYTSTITQGAQTRISITDSLGRTISVTEPERGVTTYGYAYNSTGLVVTRKRPKANQANPLVLTTTTTQYDSVGRIVGTTYDDGTPGKSYLYDAGTYWAESSSQANLKGHLSLAVTPPTGSNVNTGTLFSYDAVGRVTNTWQCTPNGCGNAAADKAMAYKYDLAGNLTSQSDPAAGNVTYGRSPAGEITSITNQTWTLSGSAGSSSLLSNPTNGPLGPISYSLGNGLSQYNSFDSMGRINGAWVCIGAPSYACPNQRNGFAATWSGFRVSGLTENYIDSGITFQYDDFNRLIGMNKPGQPSYTYDYDRYGNRWHQIALQGGPGFNQSYDASSNHLNGGYLYDAAGNMIYDTVHHYTYDAEGNILQVDSGSTGTNVYDALNQRVSVTTSNGESDSLFNLAGQITSNWTTPTTSTESHIFADGLQIAFRSGDGHTYFNHKDWLNTDRVHTDMNGATAAIYTSLPFGDGGASTINETYGGWDFARFGDMDDEYWSGTYLAQFRHYSPAQARWLSPDPYNGSYDPSNPQSFNRYVYALNNPLSFRDPSGLMECSGDDDGSCNGEGGGGGGDGGGGGGDDGPPPPPPGGCDAPNNACVTSDPSPGPSPCYLGDPCNSGSGSGPNGTNGGGGHGPAAPKNGPTMANIKQKVTRFVCKNSPDNRILASMEFGFATGALRGGVAGAVGGSLFEGVGAVPGALLGGFIGGVAGAAGGVIKGGAIAGACSLADVY